MASYREARVPAQTPFDYVEGQHPPEDFLDDFPTVRREQAIAALEQAKELSGVIAGFHHLKEQKRKF